MRILLIALLLFTSIEVSAESQKGVPTQMIKIDNEVLMQLKNGTAQMSIARVNTNEYIHASTRSARVFIHIEIESSIIGSLAKKTMLTQYCKEGESPLIEGEKYMIITHESTYKDMYAPGYFEHLQCSDCQKEIAAYKKVLKLD